jgi:hypothetical protein
MSHRRALRQKASTKEGRKSSKEHAISKAVDLYLANENALALKSYLDRGRKLEASKRHPRSWRARDHLRLA